MQASDYWKAISRRWPIVLACFVLALALGYLGSRPAPAAPVSSNAPPSYQTITILTLPGTTADPTGLSLDSMAFLANSGPVATMTSSALHGALSAAEVAADVQAAAQDTLGMLQVTAKSASPQQSATLANTFSQEIIAYLNGLLATDWRASLRSDVRQVNSLAKVVTSLRSQPSSSVVQAELSQAQSQYVSDSVSYRQLLATGPQHTVLAVLQPASSADATIVVAGGAVAPTHSLIPTSRKKLMLLAALVGLLVGVGLALVRERLDKTVRTREQAEQVFGLPVLAELPRAVSGRRGLVLLNDPLSASAEAYRILQTVLTLIASGEHAARRGTRRQVILLTSPYEVDGKEQVMANLAASFAEGGRSVTVLAMDGFDRSLPALLSGSRNALPPREPALAGESSAVGTVIDGVSLVLDGIAPGIGSGRSARHLRAVDEARSLADIVLVDTPPSLLTHDASELSSVADAVVVMCPAGEVKRDEAARAVDALRRVGAPLEGVVLVGRESAWQRVRRLLRSEPPVRRHLAEPTGAQQAVVAHAQITAGRAESVNAVDGFGL